MAQIGEAENHLVRQGSVIRPHTLWWVDSCCPKAGNDNLHCHAFHPGRAEYLRKVVSVYNFPRIVAALAMACFTPVLL